MGYNLDLEKEDWKYVIINTIVFFQKAGGDYIKLMILTTQ